MRLPRRGSKATAVDDAPAAQVGGAGADGEDVRRSGRTPGKGRPTPTRREATGRRQGPVPPPPQTRREAYKRMRQSGGRRSDTARVRAGDARPLAKRDAGPAKALARDVVDSRRNAGGLFLIVAVIVIVSYAVPSATVRQWTIALWLAAFLVIIIDSFTLSRRLKAVLRERLPGESIRGLTWYSVQRSTMIRRWRIPKPRVQTGDPV